MMFSNQQDRPYTLHLTALSRTDFEGGFVIERGRKQSSSLQSRAASELHVMHQI